MNKQRLINISYFFKKCVREGEERKTHGGKKVKKKVPFEDRRRCLCSELETKERKKTKDAREEA